ncbi:Nitrogen permease regulator 2 [Basidiobolus ranarum]|uniref:Nitrogen permease regulator 2 n=1 Tax=Basidiobolus ranarum TaxID=34480 RepID=A0ABR2W7K8_9FUNG
MEQQGFPRLLSIFYSEFHPVQGPKVLFEVPEGSITSKEIQLIDFDAISEFIIPKAALCGRKVSITTSSSKVVGYPVSIEDRKYERNALMFNLCFVFDREANTCGYEPVVKKMAGVLRALEVESEFLHDPTAKQNLQGIIEQLLEDLNNYCECQIPINAANTINLKLFPTYPNPPSVSDYQVPVCTVNLETLADLAWDMTMQKVIKFINGINHVKKIAELADVDNGMARKCIEHLLYYGCIMMVDIFQFSNIYSVKPSVRRLIEYESWQNECLSYVVKPGK